MYIPNDSIYQLIIAAIFGHIITLELILPLYDNIIYSYGKDIGQLDLYMSIVYVIFELSIIGILFYVLQFVTKKL